MFRLLRRIAHAVVLGSAVLMASCGGLGDARAGEPGFPTYQAAAEQVVIEIHSTFPRGMAVLADSDTHFAQTLARLSGGRLRALFRYSGEVVAGSDVLAAVREDRVAAGWGWVGYWSTNLPGAGVFASLPFGPQPWVAAGWMWEGGGLARMAEVFRPLGVRAIPCHLVSAEAGGWFRREIKGPEDFQGLRFRIAGLGGEVVRELGAEPVSLMVEDIYPALAANRIDAVEFSAPASDRSFGFETFAKYYYFPGWHQPSSWNILIIGRAQWARLTDTDRQTLEDACRLNVFWNIARQEALQMEAVREFQRQGVEVRRFPETVLRALARATDGVLRRHAQADPAFAAALTELQAYASGQEGWRALQSLDPAAPGLRLLDKPAEAR